MKLEKAVTQINLNKSAGIILKDLTKCITKAAKTSIPRGKQKTYKPFWNKKLADLKINSLKQSKIIIISRRSHRMEETECRVYQRVKNR